MKDIDNCEAVQERVEHPRKLCSFCEFEVFKKQNSIFFI